MDFLKMDLKKGECRNEMKLCFPALSSNEAFARVAVGAFITPLNPTLEEVSDVKTAVSEAVTNAIIHGYDSPSEWGDDNMVTICCRIVDDVLQVDIIDKGKGIDNIEQAMEPLFTTKPELDRSGMGFAFMEAFMDDLEVESLPGEGTTIHMKKKIGISSWIRYEE